MERILVSQGGGMPLISVDRRIRAPLAFFSSFMVVLWLGGVSY